jgi:hypothetical protein
VVDVRDGVCAYLQGGFGNQLFILAAGLEQAERLDCPLYVDTSRFLGDDPLERSKDTPRQFDLNSLDFPGTIIGKNSPWFRNSPRRPPPIRRPGSRSASLSVYRQPGFEFDRGVNEIRPGTTLLGYFQSRHFFSRVSDRMLDMLASAPVSDGEETILKELADDPRITLHMRRGDYLDTKTRTHHGIASAEYFTRSLALFEQLMPGAPGRVFSDSIEVVRAEVGHHEELDFFASQSRLGTIATIRAMASGSGFVMSNSSFSWWAAWLMSNRDGAARVVAPRPWQASGQSAHDLLFPSWLTLDAR